jgi:hypothetical protein
MLDYLDHIPYPYWSLIGGLFYLLARWAIQKAKKDDRKSKLHWDVWIKRESDEWIITIVGSVIFMATGDSFIRSICNYRASNLKLCLDIYQDNEVLVFLLVGGLFGTILLNTIVL